jgi:hypothetical protein
MIHFFQISQGTFESSPRAQRNSVQENSLSPTKQNGYGGGSSHGIQPNGMHSVAGQHKVVIIDQQFHCIALCCSVTALPVFCSHPDPI